MKCKCGCDRFYARQVLRTDVVVDDNNQFVENASEDGLEKCIYDAGTPYGPYTCVSCGAEYDDIIQ